MGGTACCRIGEKIGPAEHALGLKIGPKLDRRRREKFCSAVVHELAAHNRTMKMGAREEPVSHFQEREIAERVRNHSLTVAAQ